ncbi:hypothetical protein TTHERM_00794550 (macronuclear) [Tetrahymena thermophila SB210]|uniref:Uncharacterized protein n=1 Tax=Tetrahymena thermophila (strain SB210) TaxID=312017 RepID=Q23VX6_TETTS|nr:hypothetical protein TTHERM_00794550 [Tetrahymena thermophila SB210]EAS00729.2 hypothetical protein TTHERM_00794550 [Tetrahymena thermophila SB210]|eukprot:XP_001020974.2 hypothetical protein TTHERM_00794550 [Tetrahymena thermophila SB210]
MYQILKTLNKKFILKNIQKLFFLIQKMQTQDQGYSENTQITKSGRKLKFGLLFVGDNVPSDQLEDYEVAITEDGLGLRKIQVCSSKELYSEVLEIMRWAYQDFLKKRNENSKSVIQNIEMEDFKQVNQSVPSSKQEQMLSFDQILDFRMYQGYGYVKIENFKECIQYFFNKRNKTCNFQFVKYLHQKKKLSKILSIIPLTPRKQVYEEHEKKLQETIKRQEYLLKHQSTDKEQINENKQKYKFLSFDEQFKKFIAETSSSSSGELSPQPQNNQSANKIYSQINTQIAKTNFASEKKLSLKEQSIEKFENYQKNNFNKIHLKDEALSKNAQIKKVQPKVQFAQEIIKKDEMKLQLQQQNKILVQQQNEWIGGQQLFQPNTYKHYCQNEEREIIQNQTAKSKKRFVNQQDQIQQQDCQSIPQRQLGVPKFCGESLQCYLGNNSMNQKNENQEIQYSEQKYIKQIKEQQSTSINIPNQGHRVFQQNLQQEVVKQIHPSSTINFSEFNYNIQCHNENNHDYRLKDQIRQVSNSKYQVFSRLQDQQFQNQPTNLINNNQDIFAQTKNFISQKQQQNKQNFEDSNELNQAKNSNFFQDNHFMSHQKGKLSAQKQNPFKSMQKQNFRSRESSSETTQNSSKINSNSNRLQSQLKIGDKVQKCSKKFVFSQILKQQDSEIIEDDIVEVGKE